MIIYVVVCLLLAIVCFVGGLRPGQKKTIKKWKEGGANKSRS